MMKKKPDLSRKICLKIAENLHKERSMMASTAPQTNLNSKKKNDFLLILDETKRDQNMSNLISQSNINQQELSNLSDFLIDPLKQI